MRISIAFLALIALTVVALAQDNHAQNHVTYQNWINQADKGCCNDQDCGELVGENERNGSRGVEVMIEGQWCPVLAHHYLKKGNAPNWSTSHVCVQKQFAHSNPVHVCARLLCYQPKPGT